jgi:hypothetical protein
VSAESRSRDFAWHVDEHEKEEVEEQNGSGVHDDLHGGQEFRTHEQENACDVQEQSENPEHAMNGISPRDRQDRACDAGGCEIVEGCLYGQDCHVPPPSVIDDFDPTYPGYLPVM